MPIASLPAVTALALWGASPRPADEILHVWQHHGPRGGVRLQTSPDAVVVPAALAALPGPGEASGTTAQLLPLLRGRRAHLLLPRPGDVRGLGTEPSLRSAALEAGAALQVPDAGATIVPVLDQWWVWPFAGPVDVLDRAVVQTRTEDAVRRATDVFTRHQLGIEGQAARAAVEQAQEALLIPLPLDLDPRASALLHRASMLQAISAVAGRESSAAVTAGEGEQVDAALLPVLDAARSARILAVQLATERFAETATARR